MKAAGAKSVRALVSHGLMSVPAYEGVGSSALEELVYTDSIPFNKERCSKVSSVSMAKPIAETILAIQNHRSVSELNIH
jgi:ribose-phosphate pyrophosphokinase